MWPYGAHLGARGAHLGVRVRRLPRQAPKLQLREDKQRGVYVEGARTVPAASTEECLGLIESASRNLKFAATQMNRHSSRSHSVCRLTVEIKHHHAGDTSDNSESPEAQPLRPNHLAKPKSLDPLSMTAFDHLRADDSVVPGSPSDGGPTDLKAWRRKSVTQISETIAAKAGMNKTTKAVLTLCDLAGS